MKKLIKKIARQFGIEISRYTPANSDMAKIQTMLSLNKIDLVLDVGANTGQYAQSIRLGGYKEKIVSFEPLSSAYNELTHISKNDPHWIIAPRMAIGKQEAETAINISDNSVSSSIMPMLKKHLNAAPESHYIGTEKTTVSRLDAVAPEYIYESKSIYLKIDTQGFEEQVLDGANGIMQKIKCMQIELSLVPLYEGQLLFIDMIKKLTILGYDLHGILPGFTDKKTGRLLQMDGIFFRNTEINK
jgi:FkbM family methyltransferase